MADNETTPQERKCKFCGDPNNRPLGKRGPKPVYCSQVCGQRARKEIVERDEDGCRPVNSQCRVCGVKITKWPGKGGRVPKICSKPCRLVAQRESEKIYRSGIFIKCVVCSKEFEKKRKKNICCSPLCGATYSALEGKARAMRCVCVRCGITFVDHRGRGSTRKYCSRACYFGAIGAKVASEAELDRTRAKMAQKRGVEWEVVTRKVVYERDGWRCGICGKKVDKSLKYPHRMSASLDHIIPLSCGGSHTYDNVQLAHLECNSRRTHIGAAQMRLPMRLGA